MFIRLLVTTREFITMTLSNTSFSEWFRPYGLRISIKVNFIKDLYQNIFKSSNIKTFNFNIKITIYTIWYTKHHILCQKLLDKILLHYVQHFKNETIKIVYEYVYQKSKWSMYISNNKQKIYYMSLKNVSKHKIELKNTISTHKWAGLFKKHSTMSLFSTRK